jgi:hypothetical protein
MVCCHGDFPPFASRSVSSIILLQQGLWSSGDPLNSVSSSEHLAGELIDCIPRKPACSTTHGKLYSKSRLMPGVKSGVNKIEQPMVCDHARNEAQNSPALPCAGPVGDPKADDQQFSVLEVAGA